jgi:D-galactarolactone cycloisomerase
VKVYATGMYFTKCSNMTEKLQKEAISYKNRGFEAIKMKVGLGLEMDIENVQAVRQAIGKETGLMIDANHAYSLCEARQLIDRIYDLNIGWFEEPVINEDYEGYAELRRTGKILIAGGECEYLKYGALEMLSRKCVDIFQPDTCACGGITEFKKIMSIAEAYSTNLTPHNWGTGIAISANLQIACNIDLVPNRLMFKESFLEFDCSPNKLREELLVENFKPVNGRSSVPSKNGLGIEINEEKVKEFLVKN